MVDKKQAEAVAEALLLQHRNAQHESAAWRATVYRRKSTFRVAGGLLGAAAGYVFGALFAGHPFQLAIIGFVVGTVSGALVRRRSA